MKAIGLDIGTTTICAIAVDLSDGRVLKTLSKQNDASITGQQPWERLQDPGEILRLCMSLLDQLFAEFSDISSIGISGQMHGILYVGSGEAKSALVTWQDGRGNVISTEGISYAQKLSELTGIKSASGYGLVTLLYDSANGLISPEADAVCTIGDYVGMMLCGNNTPMLHPSNAAGLGCFDLSSGEFSDSLPNVISSGLLPEVIHNEAVIGEHRGVPVCCAIGDNQASVFGSLGSGVSVHVNIGTGSQISVVSSIPVCYDGNLECRPYIGGKYLSVGAGLCGGYAFNLLRDFFAETASMLDIDVPFDLYERMNHYAAEAMDEQSRVKVDTRFQGTRRDPSLRGSISNIGVSNFTPQAMCLGVLEGICGELSELSREVEPAFAREGLLAASGGGVRKSETMQRILAETFGMKTAIPLCNEEAAFGAALISAMAAGIADNEKIRMLIKYE